MSGSTRFRLGLTADFYDAQGQPKFADLGLESLRGAPQVEVSRFAEHRPEIEPDQLAGLQGAIVLTPRVTAASLSASQDLLAIGRFGVGYDSVDVDACTRAKVLATITVGAVDRPVAEATIGWMIALTHHLLVKDRLVRQGNWDDRARYMGRELRGRTLGVIGLGGIGQTLVKLLQGFGMQPPIAFDPFLAPAVFESLGVRAVGLEDLMRGADFVSVHCPLNDQTRGLIGARELGWMKPAAYLLNTARGGIVDEAALHDALKANRIAGAALDCFAEEPVRAPFPLAALDNVLLAPHAIAWTDELFRDIGLTACAIMLDLTRGRWPRGVLNPGLRGDPEFRGKWRRLIGGELEDPA